MKKYFYGIFVNACVLDLFLVETSSCGVADHEDDSCDLGVVEEEATTEEVSLCMRISVILKVCFL